MVGQFGACEGGEGKEEAEQCLDLRGSSKLRGRWEVKREENGIAVESGYLRSVNLNKSGAA